MRLEPKRYWNLIGYSRFLVLLGSLWFLCPASHSWAQEIDTRLVELQQKITEHDQMLSTLSAERSALDRNIRSLRTKLGELRKTAQGTQKAFQAARDRRTTVESQLGEIRTRMRDLSTRSRERVRALYRYRYGHSFFEQVVSNSGDLDLLKRGYYLSAVREHDSALLIEYRHQLDRYEATELELQKAVGEQEQRQKELTTQEAEIALKVKEGDRFIANLRAKEGAAKNALAALKAEVLRVETVLASIVNPEQAPRAAGSETSERRAAPMASYRGPGLEPLKGTLPYPVTGAVLPEAPPSLPASFRELVAKRGILFQGTAGEPVRAVAPGQVLFVGEMPGYGTIVILDHGERYYSLYGQLGSSAVEKGDDVSAGERIAAVLDHGVLFFELRKNGAALAAGAVTRSFFSVNR